MNPDPTPDATEPASPLAASFLDGLSAGQLRWQGCDDCGTAQHVARHACAACGSLQLSWRIARGEGIVWSTTVVTRAPSPAFQALAPYTVVLVDLLEGARVMGHARAGIAIGERVTAGFIEGLERPLLYFEPVGHTRQGARTDRTDAESGQ